MEHFVWCQEEPFQGITHVADWLAGKSSCGDEEEEIRPLKRVERDGSMDNSRASGFGSTQGSLQSAVVLKDTPLHHPIENDLEAVLTPIHEDGEEGNFNLNAMLNGAMDSSSSESNPKHRRPKFRVFRGRTGSLDSPAEHEGSGTAGRWGDEIPDDEDFRCGNERAAEFQALRSMWNVGDNIHVTANVSKDTIDKFSEEKETVALFSRNS